MTTWWKEIYSNICLVELKPSLPVSHSGVVQVSANFHGSTEEIEVLDEGIYNIMDAFHNFSRLV